MGLIAMLRGEEPNPIEVLLNYRDVGQYGEYATKYALGKNNISGYRKTFSNVYIPHRNCTTEIDVVMAHEKGVFVFESKNYGGWIFGGVEQQNWTQTFPNGEKHRFYNPIKQNATHCKAIREYLHVNPAYIFSYIVFSQRCSLEKVPEDTENYTIVRRHNLLRVLRRDLGNKQTVFSSQQVDDYANKLQAAANIPEAQKQAHVEAARKRASGTVCPYCGGKLVKRNSSYGPFWGCSRYPNCSFLLEDD